MELVDVVDQIVEDLKSALDPANGELKLRRSVVASVAVLEVAAKVSRKTIPKEVIDPSKLTAIGVPPDVQAMTQRAVLREQEKRKNRVKEWEEQGERDGVQFAMCEGGANDGCVVEIPPTLSDGTNMVVGTQSYVFRGGKLKVWEE